ncbi:MAG: hypothetical protein DWQ36_04065 [Acidobacteria bacterium]|nr:MAG: hypothetical protein DWQ30_15165 [Acidobacteriota bacterium]REK10508.1 MAG: hypothetical protein DWQ36_04065 [Acidobacteriota bacterium]
MRVLVCTACEIRALALRGLFERLVDADVLQCGGRGGEGTPAGIALTVIDLSTACPRHAGARPDPAAAESVRILLAPAGHRARRGGASGEVPADADLVLLLPLDLDAAAAEIAALLAPRLNAVRRPRPDRRAGEPGQAAEGRLAAPDPLGRLP